ncbi:unnamed protein product [Dibothriocephalus latus]|uniref:Uncharacterized protein n=1 Tax=Dibothriocephalus latus TaxID=60516 RepID=A0A3P7LSX8_DIBLA|nr:unnamed protein product [Dibothriocephalus latus]
MHEIVFSAIRRCIPVKSDQLEVIDFEKSFYRDVCNLNFEGKPTVVCFTLSNLICPLAKATSPATANDPKTEATGNANTPMTDEEGFSVPPEDRWGSQDMHQSAASSSSESSSDSDTDKTVGHSFKGIKVTKNSFEVVTPFHSL